MNAPTLKENFITNAKRISKTIISKAKAMTKKQKIISGSLVVLFLIALISMINYFNKPQFNPMDYADVEIMGLNTNAEANLIIDADIPYSEEDGFFSSLSNQIQTYEMVDNIEYDVSPKQKLSNGDTVTITAIFDKKYFKDMGYRIGKNTKKVKVKDLRDGNTVDVFETLEIKCEGISPYGHISVNNNNPNEFIRTIDYNVENNDNLRNGDTVNINAVYNKYNATEKGYIVKEETKEYKVNDLPKYAMDKTELTKDTIDKISKEIQDNLEAYLINNDSSIYCQLANTYFAFNVDFGGTDHITLKEKHFLSAKKAENSYNPNRAVYIYEFGIKADGEVYTGYIGVCAKDISLTTDNTFIDINEIETSEANTDLKTVHDRNITSYKDQYIIQEL